jgi:L,D-transpeptidase ErfK/SrfK
MLLHNILIPTLAALIVGCATSPPSRNGALVLHQELGQSSAINRFPDDYRSFIATVAQAEMLAERGDALQSENVFRQALIKGHLLETRVNEPEPSLIASDELNAQTETLPVPVDEKAKSSSPPEPIAPVEESRPIPAQPVLTQPVPLKPDFAQPALAQPDSRQPAPASVSVLAEKELPAADMRRFVGNHGSYTVKTGDSIKRVGARLGVDWRHLAKENNLNPQTPLQPGQILTYDNRKIVPSALRDGIVINIADRTLYLLKNGTVESSYPVAVGKPPKPDDGEDWSTPTGRFIITSKTKDPVWKVPQSIQDEMEQRGREPIKEMPAGKGNPLGKYAMKTSLSGILIHSTNAPSSVYSYASHGCVRVMPEHMEKLFPAVAPRSSGVIVYQPLKLAVSTEGRVFLEVNADVYSRYPGSLEGEVRKLVSRRKVESKVDWNKVARLLNKKSGIPEEITLDINTSVRPKPVGRVKTVSANRAGNSLPLQ